MRPMSRLNLPLCALRSLSKYRNSFIGTSVHFRDTFADFLYHLDMHALLLK